MAKNTKKIRKTRKIQKPQSAYDPTYIISAKNPPKSLDFTILEKFLQSQGLHKVVDYASKPTFLWMETLDDNRFDKQYYNTQCWLMSLLSNEKSVITDKYNLYKNFHDTYPQQCAKYMAPSWSFEDFIKNSIYDKKSVYIVKPAGKGASGGRDIFMIYDKKSYYNLINAVKSARFKRYDNVIVSKYITDILLFEGKKFHFRVYMLASHINGKFSYKVLPFTELVTALKVYKNTDFNNKTIHDSHFDSTLKNYICPYDLTGTMKESYETIFSNITKCLDIVAKILKPYAKPYEQAANAFEIFGCDFLVHENLDVILMEINDKVFYDRKTTLKKNQLSTLLLTELINHISGAFTHPKI
jgi:hypothetical protein